jgi:hypothetical protein
MKMGPVSRVIKAVCWVWGGLVLISCFSELTITYYRTIPSYNQKMKLYEKWCMSIEFDTDCPEICSEVRRNPPSGFYAEWLSSAFYNIKWCGVSTCDSLFTVHGLVPLCIALVIHNRERLEKMAKSTLHGVQEFRHVRRLPSLQTSSPSKTIEVN